MPAWLAQQEDKNGLMEAACLQAVSASLANPDGVRAPRLHPRYFLRSGEDTPFPCDLCPFTKGAERMSAWNTESD
jgi:hypothetical protein